MNDYSTGNIALVEEHGQLWLVIETDEAGMRVKLALEDAEILGHTLIDGANELTARAVRKERKGMKG